MFSAYLIQDIETIQPDWPAEQEKLKAVGKPHDVFPHIVFHRVICIGMLILDRDLKPVKSGCAAGGVAGGKSEKEMIERWSDVAGGKGRGEPLRLVDWHGRGFDVPVLQTRAFHYGVRMPWYLGLLPDNRGQISVYSKEYRDRYHGSHMDLADIWTNRGAFPRPHLADLAKMMGLPGKMSIDGAQVEEEFKQGRHAAIDVYCMQDVFETAFIFQRFEYMAGRLSLEEYRAAAQALYDHIGTLPEQADFLAATNLQRVLLA